jgi:putative effector of murein hydrolase
VPWGIDRIRRQPADSRRGDSDDPVVSLPEAAPRPFIISEKIRGLPSLTGVLAIMTGITGAVIGNGLLRLIHVSMHDLGGFALGVASHGIGTARALPMSEEAGALQASAWA